MSRTFHRRPPKGRLGRLRGCWCSFCQGWDRIARGCRPRLREAVAAREADPDEPSVAALAELVELERYWAGAP